MHLEPSDIEGFLVGNQWRLFDAGLLDSDTSEKVFTFKERRKKLFPYVQRQADNLESKYKASKGSEYLPTYLILIKPEMQVFEEPNCLETFSMLVYGLI